LARLFFTNILFRDIFAASSWGKNVLFCFCGFKQMPPQKRSQTQPKLPSLASPAVQLAAKLDDALVDKIRQDY
jgi:hypothetical protein